MLRDLLECWKLYVESRCELQRLCFQNFCTNIHCRMVLRRFDVREYKYGKELIGRNVLTDLNRSMMSFCIQRKIPFPCCHLEIVSIEILSDIEIILQFVLLRDRPRRWQGDLLLAVVRALERQSIKESSTLRYGILTSKIFSFSIVRKQFQSICRHDLRLIMSFFNQCRKVWNVHADLASLVQKTIRHCRKVILSEVRGRIAILKTSSHVSSKLVLKIQLLKNHLEASKALIAWKLYSTSSSSGHVYNENAILMKCTYFNSLCREHLGRRLASAMNTAKHIQVLYFNLKKEQLVRNRNFQSSSAFFRQWNSYMWICELDRTLECMSARLLRLKFLQPLKSESFQSWRLTLTVHKFLQIVTRLQISMGKRLLCKRSFFALYDLVRRKRYFQEKDKTLKIKNRKHMFRVWLEKCKTPSQRCYMKYWSCVKALQKSLQNKGKMGFEAWKENASEATRLKSEVNARYIEHIGSRLKNIFRWWNRITSTKRFYRGIENYIFKASRKKILFLAFSGIKTGLCDSESLKQSMILLAKLLYHKHCISVMISRTVGLAPERALKGFRHLMRRAWFIAKALSIDIIKAYYDREATFEKDFQMLRVFLTWKLECGISRSKDLQMMKNALEETIVKDRASFRESMNAVKDKLLQERTCNIQLDSKYKKVMSCVLHCIAIFMRNKKHESTQSIIHEWHQFSLHQKRLLCVQTRLKSDMFPICERSAIETERLIVQSWSLILRAANWRHRRVCLAFLSQFRIVVAISQKQFRRCHERAFKLCDSREPQILEVLSKIFGRWCNAWQKFKRQKNRVTFLQARFTKARLSKCFAGMKGSEKESIHINHLLVTIQKQKLLETLVRYFNVFMFDTKERRKISCEDENEIDDQFSFDIFQEHYANLSNESIRKQWITLFDMGRSRLYALPVNENETESNELFSVSLQKFWTGGVKHKQIMYSYAESSKVTKRISLGSVKCSAWLINLVMCN
eukprot:767598-Hanusia_phi.AAC.3